MRRPPLRGRLSVWRVPTTLGAAGAVGVRETLPLATAVSRPPGGRATLVRHLPHFRYHPDQSFRGWLRSILVNRWRTSHRRPPPLPLTTDPATPRSNGVEQLDEEEETQYRHHLLRQTLQALQPE